MSGFQPKKLELERNLYEIKKERFNVTIISKRFLESLVQKTL